MGGVLCISGCGARSVCLAVNLCVALPNEKKITLIDWTLYFAIIDPFQILGAANDV